MIAAKAEAGDYSEIRKGWRPLLAGMIGTGLGMPPVPFYSIGIFAPVFADEFGWSYANIFAGLIMTTATLVVGGPLMGWVLDRLGSRLVASASLCGIGLSFMLFALSTGSLIQYYATWFLLCVTGLGASPVSFTRAINRTFNVNRGLALGITLAGTGLFAFAVKPLAEIVIQEAGWRTAIVMIGAMPIFLGAPLIIWAFPRNTYAIAQISNRLTADAPSSEAGLSTKEAFRTRAFWIMALTAVPVAFATASPFPNLENILKTLGSEQSEIVKLTSIIGITIVSGRLIGGWLMDRIWAPLVGSTILIAAAGGNIILSQGTVNTTEAYAAIIMMGLAAGVEMDLLSYLVARYIGMRSYGLVYATIFGFFAVGAGVGPSLLGYAYDRSGSYSDALTLSALLLVAAAVVLLCLGRYPNLAGKSP